MAEIRDIGERRLRAGEILKLSYREVFGPGIREYLIPILILFLFAGGAYLTLRGEFLELSIAAAGWAEEGSEVGRAFVRETMRDLAFRGVMTGLLVGVLYIIGVLYILRRMRRSLFGGQSSIGEDLFEAISLPRVLSLAIAGFIAYLMVAVAGFFLFLPGLVLAGVLFTLPACIAFSEKKFSLPLGEPFRMVSGAFGRQFGVFMSVAVVVFVGSMVMMVPMTIVQMGGFRVFGNGEPAEMYPALFSMGFMIYQGFVALVVSLLYLVLGYASVILYHNGDRP